VREIGMAVQRVNQELGMTVLLVEQKLPFARWVAQQFCIVDKGRAVATGAITDLHDDLVRQYLTV
ncbi:MAG TPA: ABC transporter ATP-binding protein, partial [Candidatus Competibacteraceae bacterium]|nr:ABC transporter ATP-binding protein [Candidatus Competibacteraceae bacterium]